MTFEQSLSYLLSLGHETLAIKLGLANTDTLLAALGNPQKHFPSVQIAGTNGKGSTAVMLDSICRNRFAVLSQAEKSTDSENLTHRHQVSSYKQTSVARL